MLEYGHIFLFGSEYDEEKMRFTSYSGPEEYELQSPYQILSGDPNEQWEMKEPQCRCRTAHYWDTGESPGVACRSFLTERNIKTGEIRIRYSEILSIKKEDLK